MTDTFRLSNGLTLALSPALFAQLQRHADATKTTRAKTVRRAAYFYMQNHTDYQYHSRPASLPSPLLPPDRPRAVSWTYSSREDRAMFERLAKEAGLKPSAMYRRAIYVYTKDHVSPDKQEALEAAADAWV